MTIAAFDALKTAEACAEGGLSTIPWIRERLVAEEGLEPPTRGL